MKKLFKLLFIMVLTFVSVFALTACGEEKGTEGEKEKEQEKEVEKVTEKVKKVENGSIKYYSIDLTDIAGYETVKVENGTWQETYDELIKLAKKEADDVKREKLYHKAEDLLMSTGCIVPIYYYTDIYMKKENVTGYFGTPTGTKFFKYTKVNGFTANINVNLASEPDTIDPAANSSVDGATIVLHAFSGLTGYDKDGNIVADLAKELPTPQVGADGKVTYVFELKDDIKWSNEEPITAQDFVYSWNRAANEEAAFDYGYLFEIVDGYGTNALNVTASEDGKKLTVVLPVDVPYFFELCAFPTFMPVYSEVVDENEDTWATAPATYVSSGAYTLTSWEHDSKIVLTKNENYWDADNIVMEQITMWLSADDTAILANYKNGTYDFIDSVPNDEIATLQADYPNEYFVTGQLGTYYVIFNNNTDLVPSYVSKDWTAKQKLAANEEIRYALSLLLDRNYIVEEIGQAGQLPASSFVAMGITNADGSEFYESAGGNDYAGYFNTAEEAYAANCKEAVEILKKYFEYDEATKKFTNFTEFDYLFNTGTGHQAIGEYIQSCYAAYGIKVSLENQEWDTFLVTRKDGNYTVARNGWLADYNDAINMLDMWTSYSGNNDAQFGK